jgi:thymidylate synthase
MVCSAWNPNQMHLMALPPCHYSWGVVVYGDKLNLHWNQRSVDSSHGLPCNIASYGLLMMLLCEESGLQPGELVGKLEDCHLYDNTIGPMQELVSREEKELPQMKIKRKTDGKFSIFDWEYTDVELIGYDPHPAINVGAVTV